MVKPGLIVKRFGFFVEKKHIFQLDPPEKHWACDPKKCLKQQREAKNMKPLWKDRGFEQHILTTVDREGDTNRQTKSHSDTQEMQTHGQTHGQGHGHGHGLCVRVCAESCSLGVVAKWVGPVFAW